MKTLALIIVMTFFSLKIKADCPHCYTIARIDIEFNDGKKYTGYSPIFGWYFEGHPRMNINILKELSSMVDTILFIDTFYTFDKIPFLFDADEIRKISKKKLSKFQIVEFLNDKSGAGTLPTLNKVQIDMINKSKIYQAIPLPEGLCYGVYININNIDTTEFSILINNLHVRNTMDDSKTMLSRLWNLKINEATKYDENVYEIIKEEYTVFFKVLNSEIQILERKFSSKDVDEYMSFVIKNKKNELEYNRLVFQYLTQSNESEILEYIDSENGSRSVKEAVLKILKSGIKESQLLQNYLNLLKSNWTFNSYPYKLNNMLNKFLVDNNIYKVYYCGD